MAPTGVSLLVCLLTLALAAPSAVDKSPEACTGRLHGVVACGTTGHWHIEATVVRGERWTPDYVASPETTVSIKEEFTTAAPPQDQVTGVADLGALLDAGEGAIVTLVSGETRLAAHRAVLSATSSVFAAMVRHDTLEANTGEIAIPDVEGPVLRQLVGYMYTGRAPQLPGMAHQLLRAADKYNMDGLKDACEQQVVAQLDVENAAAAAVLCVRHSCPTLREAAVNFVRGHADEVMATQGWAEAVQRQPEDIAEFLRLLAKAPPDTSAPAAAADPAVAPTTTSAADPITTSATASAALPTTASAADPTTAPAIAPTSTSAAIPTTASVTASAASITTASSTASAADPATTSATGSTAAPQPAAHCQTPPPDDEAVSYFRSLSGIKKGRMLIQAAKEGAVEELRALLAAGADVGARDEFMETALHWAVRTARVEAVQCLLEAGAAVDARSIRKATPLHNAAGVGHAAVVRLLLAASADPDARDELGMRPLHMAASWGRLEAVAALLEGGADRGARDMLGGTALERARNYHHQQVVDLLRENT